ncbi:MAG: DNA polymerase III subunit gamma/tau [Mucilaginibacter sp.]|uniref:DNA polymerase III subunit gamma/tau n=1 Tax=Mucilaginibacter sp. TaxID=1882438 RepID=UPI003266780C
MDNFIVSARKYRPVTFDTVVGQQHITNTLKNAIRNNQLAQAFLFCGPRGVGKTTCARILAKTINCTNLQANAEACGECESCVAFQRGNSFNFHELDAASNNSVEDIRSLIEQVRIPPQAGKYKIYIIDEVHMLSQAAFNAFLKTLEEPPSYAIFILATTEKHKILPTILSRCQIFDFNRIRVEDMAGHLESIANKENIKYETDGLHIIAQKADGGLRDALSMFDQIVNFSGSNVTYRSVIDNLNILDYDYYFNVTQSLLEQDTAKTLLLFDEILAKGFDGSHFISGLTEHFRNLLVGKDTETLKLLEVSEGIRKKYISQSQGSTVSFLLSAMNIANICDLNYKLSKNQRLQVELALLKMCHIMAALNLANSTINTNQPEGQVKKKPELAAPEPSAPTQQAVPIEQPKPVVAPVSQTPSLQATPGLTPSLSQTPSTPSLTAKPVVQADKVEQPTAERPAIAMPVRSLSTPSLKAPIGSVGTDADEEEDPYLKGTDKEPFTTDDFLKYWHLYAAKIKEQGKKNLLSIFTTNAPVMLKPYIFEVIAGTKVQEMAFRDEKPFILNFLRTSLKNFDLDIQTRVDEIQATKRLYSAQDKYAHMATKNPELAELKRRFNLEIE